MNNTLCHPENLTLLNIQLAYLPTNISSVLQPLEKGNVETFKLHYHKRFTNCLLVTAHNLMDLVKKVNSMSEIAIKKYFENCGFQKSKDIHVEVMR